MCAYSQIHDVYILISNSQYVLIIDCTRNRTVCDALKENLLKRAIIA